MAEGCGEGRSAFAFHEIERVSEPMRIGRHEWRLVAYWRAGMEYIDGGLWEEVERRLVGYEWRPAGGQGAWREVRNRASGGRGICQATRRVVALERCRPRAGGHDADRKPFPFSWDARRPVGRRSGSGLADGAAGVLPSRRAACRRRRVRARQGRTTPAAGPESFPASCCARRPVGRRSGFERAGGAAGAGPSRRAACRRLRGRFRMSLLAGLSRRYVSRGPGAAGPSRPFVRRGRRDCSGSTRLRYRRDTAGELNRIIGAVVRFDRVCSNEVGSRVGSGTGPRSAVEWAVRVSPGFRSRPSLSAERRHVQPANGAGVAGASVPAFVGQGFGGGIGPVASRAAATARRISRIPRGD